MRFLLSSTVALYFLLAPAAALAQQAVFVVRHAERADASPDAALSEQGQERARRLSTLLARAEVRAVFASEYRRTQQTAQPLALARKLKVQVVPALDTTALAERVRQVGPGTSLVVGHSNTVGPLIQALGCVEEIRLGEDQYDRLFLVIPRLGSSSLLVELAY